MATVRIIAILGCIFSASIAAGGVVFIGQERSVHGRVESHVSPGKPNGDVNDVLISAPDFGKFDATANAELPTTDDEPLNAGASMTSWLFNGGSTFNLHAEGFVGAATDSDDSWAVSPEANFVVHFVTDTPYKFSWFGSVDGFPLHEVTLTEDGKGVIQNATLDGLLEPGSYTVSAHDSLEGAGNGGYYLDLTAHAVGIPLPPAAPATMVTLVVMGVGLAARGQNRWKSKAGQSGCP